MTLNRNLQQFMEAAQHDNAYWIEQAKIDFALALDLQRKRQNMTLGELAQKLGTSPAYITKVFRGDCNFTIETMVKMATATGTQLDIQLKTAPTAHKLWQVTATRRPQLRLVEQQTVTTVSTATWGHTDWAPNRMAA
ncbi:helix-turn-helix transcriptional regulator [Limnohabitans sp.]|uniref:helix-turn-helix domain-containing protein n=1 Tax=Limnohabitans sp. TaxID=1907725 RepID=UPI00286F5200|nr:helix-turn-helix transcriptional regulator [Limnohabitans sp.]